MFEWKCMGCMRGEMTVANKVPMLVEHVNGLSGYR